MPRQYKLKRRAERQEETRLRIVEAAVALHTTFGPARTTVSAIAERARVQRHTFYRHFPEMRDLGIACSGLYLQRNPLPDVRTWRTIADPERRLRHGLNELYAYYKRTGAQLAPIIRDAEVEPITREFVELRIVPHFVQMRDLLAEPFRVRGLGRRRVRAMLELFLDFHTWRLCARAMSQTEAVEAAVRALRCQ
jgi:AcrR family transcriptional regulator